MLQRGDHAGLQAALGNLQVTVQAIDQVDQQLLLLQLALSHLALQGHAAARVVEGQLAITAGVDGAKCGLVGVRASLSRLQTLSIRITRAYGLGGTDRQAWRKVLGRPLQRACAGNMTV
jgi:hypothetical protein